MPPLLSLHHCSQLRHSTRYIIISLDDLSPLDCECPSRTGLLFILLCISRTAHRAGTQQRSPSSCGKVHFIELQLWLVIYTPRSPEDHQHREGRCAWYLSSTVRSTARPEESQPTFANLNSHKGRAYSTMFKIFIGFPLCAWHCPGC